MKTCTYDPLYRLLSATGKEKGLWQDTIPWQEWDSAAPNDVNRPYFEHYVYDKIGFMIDLKHRAEDTSYKYRRRYSNGSSNRLTSMTAGGNTFAFSYDENDNLTSGNGNHYCEWDYRYKLQRCYVAANNARTKSMIFLRKDVETCLNTLLDKFEFT